MLVENLPDDEKCLTMCLHVSIQYTHVTDGRSNGWMNRHRMTA